MLALAARLRLAEDRQLFEPEVEVIVDKMRALSLQLLLVGRWRGKKGTAGGVAPGLGSICPAVGPLQDVCGECISVLRE